MAYRTLKINWIPSSRHQWATFTAVRIESGRLWSWLVERHADVRAVGSKWPSKADLQKEIKRQFPNLHSQSAQQTVGDFCEAISSAESLRKKGDPYQYPHKKKYYRQVTFTNQAARIRNGRLFLPCGAAGDLVLSIPDGVAVIGRMMEARLNYGSVEIVCQVEEETRSAGPVIGVDLGVNTVVAATDGAKAVLVSGREIKATIQLRNKLLAAITSKLSRKERGSRRHRKIQRRKYQMLDKAKNKVRDLCHKATRKVADAFPNAKAYVGEPFNGAAQKTRRVQAQQVSQACGRKIIDMLNYKLVACIEVNEAYSSQTCPVCGERSKHRRVYRCRCGFEAPRDVVGCSNIRAIGIDGEMQKNTPVPSVLEWRHPSKYPGVNRVAPRTQGKVARRKARNHSGKLE